MTLHGIADRIDRLADGSLAIVDYKTGSPPSGKAVARRLFAAARPARPDRRARRLRRHRGRGRLLRILEPRPRPALGPARLCQEPGRRPQRPRRRPISPISPTRNFIGAAAKWLTGDEPFTAKLHPEYAPYGDYDQLMRLDEWYGRTRAALSEGRRSVPVLFRRARARCRRRWSRRARCRPGSAGRGPGTRLAT